MFDGEKEIWKPLGDRDFDPQRELREETQYATEARQFTMTEILSRSALFAQGQNKMAAIACALELHFKKQGNYPITLEALVPEFLPRQPVDPCGGESYRYRTTPNGTY